MKNKNIVIFFIILVMIAAGSFFGGMKYQESKRSQSGRQAFSQNGQERGRQGVRPVNGQIIGIDDKSITVKMRDGSSKIVILSSKTSINKSAQGSKSDLKEGESVAVFGTENSDGSVTADNLQVNPLFRGMSGMAPSKAQ